MRSISWMVTSPAKVATEPSPPPTDLGRSRRLDPTGAQLDGRDPLDIGLETAEVEILHGHIEFEAPRRGGHEPIRRWPGPHPEALAEAVNPHRCPGPVWKSVSDEIGTLDRQLLRLVKGPVLDPGGRIPDLDAIRPRCPRERPLRPCDRSRRPVPGFPSGRAHPTTGCRRRGSTASASAPSTRTAAALTFASGQAMKPSSISKFGTRSTGSSFRPAVTSSSPTRRLTPSSSACGPSSASEIVYENRAAASPSVTSNLKIRLQGLPCVFEVDVLDDHNATQTERFDHHVAVNHDPPALLRVR